ncbi:amidohydrolase family protein [Dactylosporangium sp. NPDC051485]|uniref:amidohydrolase family protein n=1 Tax=Dactylosporangium sp. NPDC051485 TaxID=3154846 RepID=UPI0034482B8A
MILNTTVYAREPEEIMSKLMVISSDGHATARMRDYAPYLPASLREEFEDFCKVYDEGGTHTFEERALSQRLDPYLVEEWKEKVIDPGRLEGNFDPAKRLVELDKEGVAGEVLFPDFGLPFELYSPLLAAQLGEPPRRHPHEGNQAFNRWLADFISHAPDRLVGLASVDFSDVDRAVREIKWAKNEGFRGIMLPMFEEDVPLWSPVYDPIWATLADLELVANSHVAISATTSRWVAPKYAPPHPVCLGPLFVAQVEFFCRQILDHMIWGGVLERHPKLQLVLTEQGSGWIPAKLKGMDYSYDGSFLRRDIRTAIKHKPSEYFARQVHIGSSLLTKAEVEIREAIGVDKMMVGVDYPHHEGTWNGGTQDYFQATFGANEVPLDQAKKMLGENAAKVFGFDVAKLQAVADRIGPEAEHILVPPAEDKFPRGDVHKPLGGANIG